MADNIDVTPGVGATVHADEYVHTVLGSGKSQIIKIADGAMGGETPLRVVAEDAPSAGGEGGILAMGIRKDVPAALGADLDFQYPLFDSTGKQWVAGVYPEDTASANLDPVNVVGAKRQLAPANSSGTDLDYEPLQMSAGKLWTTGSYPEDTASADLDPVNVMGAKRQLAPANSSGTDLDYEPLQMSAGKLWIAGVYPEDTASADLDPVTVIGAKRLAVPANSSGTDGDYEPLQMNAGALWVSPLGFPVSVQTDITRPADTAVYAANDALSNSTTVPTAGGFTFTGAARKSGGSVLITDMIVTSSNDPATPLQGEVFIFNTAVTAINDNAAFVVSDAEIKTLVARIPFALEDVGNNDMYHAQNLNIVATASGSADLRFLVRVKNAYTPASAEVITVILKGVQLN